MHAPAKIVGIEQIDDTVIMHSKRDLRPILAYFLWAVMMAATLLVVGSCDDSNNGMYQGPNDDAPRYGRPK
jgi:hypothetical protein